ncbi:hypothetical protein C8Q80DRAFT_880789 [Daedaleopsis nitida]|nr:hypothetical protein C8Q80DRAFT_880789 [Daedaleopsis nitida]
MFGTCIGIARRTDDPLWNGGASRASDCIRCLVREIWFWHSLETAANREMVICGHANLHPGSSTSMNSFGFNISFGFVVKSNFPSPNNTLKPGRTVWEQSGCSGADKFVSSALTEDLALRNAPNARHCITDSLEVWVLSRDTEPVGDARGDLGVEREDCQPRDLPSPAGCTRYSRRRCPLRSERRSSAEARRCRTYAGRGLRPGRKSHPRNMPVMSPMTSVLAGSTVVRLSESLCL